MKGLLLSFFALAIVFSAQSQSMESYGMQDSDVPQGLQEGATAPNFKAKTSTGETFQLSKALKKNAVALVFYRGYWCGYCDQALSAYSDSLSYLKDMGIDVVAVTPETYEHVAETVDAADITYTVLSDTDGEIMRAFDVDFKVTDAYQAKIEKSKGATLEEINGSDVAELPIPATYLIVRDGKSDNGVVVWRHFDPNYRKRASVNDIIKALDSLK